MATDLSMGLLEATWYSEAVDSLRALAPPNTTFQQRHRVQLGQRHATWGRSVSIAATELLDWEHLQQPVRDTRPTRCAFCAASKQPIVPTLYKLS